MPHRLLTTTAIALVTTATAAPGPSGSSATAATQITPSGQGCVNATAKALPYCDPSLTHAERITDLLSRLTPEEKALHLWGSGTHADNTTFPGVPRIGLPSFDWGLEAQHGLRVGCVSDPSPNATLHCPTTFPAPPGLGATFNDTLVQSIGQATAIEARALNNQGVQGSGRIVLRTPGVCSIALRTPGVCRSSV